MAERSRASDALDRLAQAVFGGRKGAQRLAPLAERFAVEVAPEPRKEEVRARWLALRLDWALCEASIPGGRGRGDTWARRAAEGRGPGAQGDGVIACATWLDAITVVGRAPPVARCAGSGLVGPVEGVRWPPQDASVADPVWGVRLLGSGSKIVVCRAPWALAHIGALTVSESAWLCNRDWALGLFARSLASV